MSHNKWEKNEGAVYQNYGKIMGKIIIFYAI